MTNSKLAWWIGGGVVVVALAVIVFTNHNNAVSNTVTTVADPSTLPGIETGTSTWPVELDNLKSRLSAIGLPALSEEGTVLHIHQHLDIYIDGKPVAVPAGVGINDAARFISPIHVHDETGVIHVESPTVQNFTLGQFFDIWGLKFTSSCIGGYCNSGDKTLTVYVNGAPYAEDPRELVLAAHQEIVVAYGTSAELPNPIPSTFNFPQGE
jgi:hypothetical protein